MSGDSFVLADLDVLGDDETLREQAEAARDAADGELSDTYQADEPTGSVRVTVDHRGLLVDVRLAERWSDRLEPARFAETLFGVYMAAVHKALVIEMAAREDPPPRQRTAQAPPEPELSIEEWLTQIKRTLADNDARLLAARRAESLPDDDDDDDDDDDEWRSEHGYVTLHVRGGMATGLTANAGVLGYADTAVLRGDVLEVFTDAGLAVEG
jgi:hypothetical protein